MNLFFKKGAMFGLDARIALAIFGALSVISGAALYSAIKESKYVSFYTQTQELAKAIEQYYLDHQEMLPSFGGTVIDIRYLIENRDSSKNWNGPYIDCERGSTTDTYGYLYCNGLSNASLSTYIRPYTKDGSTLTACTSDDCFIWMFYHVANTLKSDYQALFDYIDERYDGGDGETSGNIQMSNISSMYILIKVMPNK